MTRISDLGLQQLLLGGLQGARNGGEVTQTQIASGTRAQDYATLGRDRVNLVSAEGLLAQFNAFNTNTDIAAGRFDRQAISLETISEHLTLLRRDVAGVLANQNDVGLAERVETSRLAITDAFNAQSGGQFVFGGVANDAGPISRAPSGQLQVSDTPRTAIQIDAQTIIDGGLTAGEVAPEIFAILDQIDDLQVGGSINSLGGVLTRLDELLSLTNDALAQTGLRQQEITQAGLRNARSLDLAQRVASDIEDTDIAEALSRLSQDQLALNASVQAFAIATQTSILNFI